MGMNFQDVLRDVHDPDTHSLKTNGGGGVVTVAGEISISGTPSLSLPINYTEDDPAPSNPIGPAHMLIRVDAPATLVSNEGDNVVQRATNYGAGFVQLVSSTGSFIDLNSLAISSNVTVYIAPYSFYQQASLASGYVYYGFALPGSNPTIPSFKIQRETINTGEVLFASGVATFTHRWSAASLASLTYL